MELTEEYVRSFLDEDTLKGRGKKCVIEIVDGIVNIKGAFYFKHDVCKDGKLPFKFGKVTNNFVCDSNGLITLEGAPDYVGGYFYCKYNELESLEYCPKYIGRCFACQGNKIKNFVGCPEVIYGQFDCGRNPNLESFEGCPKKIGKSFHMFGKGCKITSLDGFPKEVGMHVSLVGLSKEFTIDDIMKVCDVKGRIMF